MIDAAEVLKPEPVIQVAHLNKQFMVGKEPVEILRDCNVTLFSGITF